jgi:chemotaxis protein MotB
LDSGYYAACAGLKTQTQALDVVANNVANINTNGYSTSQVDKRKVGKLALAIQVAFQELGAFPTSSTQVPVDTQEPMPFSDVQTIENVDHTAALGRLVAPPHGDLSSAEEDGDLGDLRYELEQALAPEISRREVALRSVPDGLVISLLEIGFFESGSAQIKNSSMPAFTRMAGLLAQRKYRIRIEGHTDNVPIHNSRFHSNWELSTERATEVIRILVIRYDFAPERLSAAGYSQYHPVATNDSREGRGLNRRVDVVVLGRESEPHNAARTQSSAPRKLPDDDRGPAKSASDSFRLARFTFERQMYMHRLVRLLYPVP